MTNPEPRHMRPLAITLTATICAITITACGSSGNPAGQHTAVSAPGGTSFSDCMRAHGVPDFPDAGPGGGYNIPPSINTAAPAFIGARKKCGDPAGGPLNSSPPSAAQVKLAVTFSTCMRKHGINNFPDPSRTPPSPATTSSPSVVLSNDGMYYLFSGNEIQTTAFATAAADCGLHLGKVFKSTAF